MLDTVLRSLLSIPLFCGAVVCVLFWVYSVVSVIVAVCTKSYVMINNVENFFAPSSTPGQAFIVTGSLTLLSLILKELGFISTDVMYVFIGSAVYTSIWYLSYIIDMWYTLYKQYVIKKDIQRLRK